MTLSAYASLQRSTLSGRNLEREVLTRITARLERFDPDRPGSLSGYLDALEDNRRLWGVLAVDLAAPGNPLPDDVKASLISLALFVEKRTSVAREDPSASIVLAEINRNIIQGLSSFQAEAA